MQNTEQDESERERQLDAIIAEYYRLSDAGGVADQNEFIQGNPDFSSELKDFFADARLLHSQDQSDPTNDLLGPTIAMGTSRPAKPAAGSVVRYFGEYEILEELGSGGMGVVYKARQTKLKRIVALKMIRSGELANAMDLQRFEAEAKAAAKLSHPGIVSVHEVGIYNGQHFYTMDFVEGGNLSQLHREEPVPAKHAVKLVRQLAESMHYAHLKGIVHRDLKPANILLTADGEPRITDFGLAKRVRDDDESHSPTLTESGQILGTAGYMSPEQAAGKSRLVGPASDIYSLGAVLYALLTGQAPFAGETPSHTIMQVLHKEPVSPRTLNPSVPRDLETICLKCLEKEPHKRYGAAQLLADDLRLFLEGKPVKARPVGSIERGWRWCRRNSVLTALVCVILLVVLCLPIVVWSQVMTIVDGVQDARAETLPDLISDMHAYPSFLVTPILNNRFAKESDSHRKLSLACAMADFGTVKTDYLVSQVEAVGEGDTGNLLNALAADREASLKVLTSEVATSTNEKKWRRKSQLAILALHLGDPEAAADMCKIEDRPDPVQRTVFIDEFSRWDADMKELCRLVESSTDIALRSAAILGTGTIADGRLSLDELRSWQALAERWHASEPDAVTHSATGWLLRRRGILLPEISVTTGRKPTNDWYMNSQGQTFLKIKSGCFRQLAQNNGPSADRDVTISEAFWLMDAEVSVGQFQRFIEDSHDLSIEKTPGWFGVAPRISPTPDHPVPRVSRNRVLEYCNWLSAEEGFSPAYERTGDKETVGGNDDLIWRPILNSVGYRLPREAEWEYACRAGTTTSFSCGENEEVLRQYAQNQQSTTDKCGVKLPNGWGLWDMHGNIWEWCQEDSPGYTVGRVMRGGAYYCPSLQLRSSYRYTAAPLDGSAYGGFRLARTLSSEAVSSTPHPECLWPRENQIVVGKLAVLKSRRLIQSGPGPTSAQHSSDNSQVLIGGHDRLARLLSVKTGELIQEFRGHEKPIWSVAISPDSQTAVTGSEDETLILWDVASGRELDRYPASGIFSCVRYSTDGTQIFATNWDGKVRIWKPSEGKLGDPIDFTCPTSPLDIAMMPNQEQFVIGTVSGQILLWDAETGVVQKTFQGHSGWVHSVVVLDSGKRILSASHDSTLRLWNIETRKTERVYTGHSGPINEVRATPDGKRFVSVGADRTIRLWDVNSRREWARGNGSGELRALSIASDGKSCVSAGLDGSLWEWELPGASVPSPGRLDGAHLPQMLTGEAYQADFNDKWGLGLRPSSVFVDVDITTNQPVFAIEWGPADGQDCIVHHDMSDSVLEQNEAAALRLGYQRAQIRTVPINGLNHHIGLWTKVVAKPQQ